MEQDNCLRCGLPENHAKHHPERKHPKGWHPFRGQAYLDGLEDALLFARENNQPHGWNGTGVIIDTNPSFPEKRCKTCGAVNWGGKEDGVCFGNWNAELGIIAAHNRRAFARMNERLTTPQQQEDE
jgi:hypothetical protein